MKAIAYRCVAIAMAAGTTLACDGRKSEVPATDLITGFREADRRPPGSTFGVTDISIAGEAHRAISTESISRITWQLSIPDRAVLKTSLALKPEAWTREGNAVLFRVGIAEGRTYEQLMTRLVDPFQSSEDRRWIPVTIDLAAYGGFKWSVFYQPRRLTWRLIFSTNPGTPGTATPGVGVALWGEPMIYRYGSPR
jgi:hypothetical protein